MKKFAANFILSDSGNLLKNGILIANDDGNVMEIVDTKGNLDEIAQLTFHNGILLTNNFYIKKNFEQEPDFLANIPIWVNDLKMNELQQLSTPELIEKAKQAQTENTELKIADILNSLFSYLRLCFEKQSCPGIFLLMGSDLIGLHFKPQSRLKRIL